MIKYLDLQQISDSFQPELDATLHDVASSGRYLMGRRVAAFEAQFAAYVGQKHCIGVGNGFDALTLTLMALKQIKGWADGDEVVVPALTFVASAQAVTRAGLQPVFCDVGKADALMDLSQLPACLTPRTRALLPVHLYGRMCPMDALLDIADRHGLTVVEDAAQAHGATLGQRRAGAWGEAAAFSFYPGKNLGAFGDAGAVVTGNDTLAERVRQLANYGSAGKYRHLYFGLNSRLDELQAAVLSLKLRRLDADNERRRDIARLYASHIRSPFVTTPPAADASCVWHIYPVRSPFRDQLQAHLLRCGVETLIHYPLPLHRQPVFSACSAQSFPASEAFAAEELSLPMSPLLTPEDALCVCRHINAFHPES